MEHATAPAAPRWHRLPSGARAIVQTEIDRRAAPEWDTWRAAASHTRSRLARIIKNCARFDDSTFQRLLDRIDSAITRDSKLQDIALDASDRAAMVPA